MDRPLVSVIVPTRNSADTLAPCLTSIARQTYPRVETIVVDRDSSDATPEIARAQGARFLTAHPERSAQRNAGARAARGERVLFIDSDMVLDPHVVEACVRACTQREAAAAAVIPETGFEDRFFMRVRGLEKRCYIGNGVVEAPRFFRRAEFLSLGGYDERLSSAEDWDLADRWRARGGHVVRANALIYHDDRALTFRRLLVKRYRYGRLYLAYLRKNRAVALGHLRPGRFLSRFRLLAREPGVALGLFILKALETLWFAFGVLAGSVARDDEAVFGRMSRSVSLLRHAEGERVLDVGCSGGWLAQCGGGSRLMIGVDISAPADRSRAASRFAQADARTLPFADESFDIVTLFEVLEHVPEGSEPRALSEVCRVLRPGGTLLLSTPNRHPMGTGLDPAWWLRGHRHYRPGAVAELLARTGFADVRLSTGGRAHEAFYIPIFYLFKGLHLRIPFESSWRRAIDREYRGAGWYTIFATARRPAAVVAEAEDAVA